MDVAFMVEARRSRANGTDHARIYEARLLWRKILDNRIFGRAGFVLAPQTCRIQIRRLNWVPADRVILDATGKLHFPTAPTSGGLYRFKTKYPDGRFAVYVGESDNLRRRFSNYRNPGPTQQTSLRINAWLRELLSSGGEISVALVDQATMSSEAGTANANFSQKSVRRLFEQLAISVEHASEIESLNR